MDENTSPILVWILILVVAAVIGVAAITTEIHHNESLAAATSTNAGATTTDATSSLNANIAAAVSNPTPSASAPEPSPYRYSPIPTEATSAVSASIGQSAARPDFAPCTANDLTGSAGWQGAGGTLTGAIKLENSSDSACSLPHAVRLAMMSSSETLPVDQTGPTDQGNYTDLYPGYQAYLWFS